MQELQAKLIAEIDAATTLSNEYQRLSKRIDEIDEQLNDVINNMPVNNVDEAEQKKARLDALRQSLSNGSEFKSQLEHLMELNRPIEHVLLQSNIDVDGLIAHYAQLLNTIEQAELELQQRSRIVQLEPEMTRISVQLQEQLNDIQQEPLNASVDDYQKKLEELELKKHQLEDMLQRIPDDTEEGKRMREKCSWQLSQLTEWLKKIGGAIGDKLAALAAFNAKKKNINQQVADIREKMWRDDGKIRTIEQLTVVSDELEANRRRLADILHSVEELIANDTDLPDDARMEAQQLHQTLLDMIHENDVRH